MEDRIENLRKQVIKVFNEDLCDEDIVKDYLNNFKEVWI